MKIAIMYKSKTGNTKEVAQELRKEVLAEELVYFGELKEGVEADLYVLGSWTDKGSCDEEMREYLGKLRNKKIAYYATAGFGGAPTYFETLFGRVYEGIDASNEVVGHYYCQGRMPSSIKERYEKQLQENPEDQKVQVSLANFNKAMEHPNREDKESAREWLRKIIEEGSK